MAFTNVTREDRFFQKKEECFFAVEYIEGTGNSEFLAESQNYLMAVLPPDSVITNAFVHVKTASDAATSAVMTIGTAEAGTEILSAADLTATGEQGTFTGQSLTGSGQEIYVGVTVTGAATEVGEYIIVIEYIEYTKNTGDYTQFSRTPSTT